MASSIRLDLPSNQNSILSVSLPTPIALVENQSGEFESENKKGHDIVSEAYASNQSILMKNS